MPLVSRNTLKSFFTPGAKPSSLQFNALLDSVVVYADDNYLLGLNNYDPTLIYTIGKTVVYNQIIYQAIANTTPGPFNIIKWNKIAGSTPGSVTYKGTWDASTNSPNLNTVVKALGDYYIVSVAGNTPLNTPPNVISDWNVGDWAIYDGTLWGKVDNTDSVTDAANVGAGAGLYQGKNNTVLDFKSITNTDGSVFVNSNPNSIDIGVQFDDTGTSVNRSWTANKINNELNTKQPLIGYTTEDIANKVSTLSGASTNTQYTGAKLVFDQLALKQNNIGYTAEDVANKVSTLSGASTNTQYTGAKLVFDQLALKQDNIGYTAEDVANKVSTLSGASTNTQYTGAKLVFDQLALKQDNIGYTTEDVANKVSTLSGASTNTQYTGAKLVFDQLALKQDNIGYTTENVANKVIAFQPTPDDTHYPSEKLVADKFANYSNVDNTSDMNKPVSTAQAAADALVLSTANAYSDSLVIGLLNDRGNYDASGNTFPATGGSGTGGAIKKGDLWTISVAGVLGGSPVEVGDLIRALQNAPGQTASKWAITQANIGYVAENAANKVTTLSGSSTDTQYPSAKLAFDQLALKENLSNKVTALSGSSTDTQYPSAKLAYDQLALKEILSNKVTALSGSSTDTQYPSAKLLFDKLALKQDNIGYTTENVANKVTTLSGSPTDTQYPSAKSVADKFATLSNVQNTKVNFSAAVDPLNTDGSNNGYSVGSTWMNTVTKKEFVCVDSTSGLSVWKEITNSVFGNDYLAISSQTVFMNSSINFAPYNPALPVPPGPATLMLSTGTRNGTYRIQWSCVTGNTGKRVGEVQFVDYTNPASPVLVGLTLSFQFNQDTDRLPMGGTVDIVLNGINKDYVIQFREVTGATQKVYSGRIEIFRVS